jgi:uncharacterized alkaline shock family protein YloU
MRFLGGLTLFFYTLVFFIVSALLIMVALNIIPQGIIADTMTAIYASQNTRLVIGIIGALLAMISVMVVQVTIGKIQREKTIAFENPDGQVTISLTAIEDFIRRALKQLPEVKELRPSVKAGKKGIKIINKVVLFSDINIPETTERIQNIVKNRVQEMLGVEEPISIMVHVIKIVHKEEPAKNTKKDEAAPQFKGTIEYGKF